MEYLRSKRFHFCSNLHWTDGSITFGVVGGIQDDDSFLFRLVGSNIHVRIVIENSKMIYRPIERFFGEGNYLDCWDSTPIFGTELISIVPEDEDQGTSLDATSQT